MRIQGRTVVVVSSMLLLALASKPAIADDGAGPQLETAPVAPVVVATPMSGGIWSTKRKIAVWTAAGGVVALTLGGAFGLSAMKQQRDAHSRCPDPRLGCRDADAANSLIHSAHDSALVADVLFGVAAVATVTAGVLWFTGSPESHPGVAVLPTVSSEQLVLSASGSF